MVRAGSRAGGRPPNKKPATSGHHEYKFTGYKYEYKDMLKNRGDAMYKPTPYVPTIHKYEYKPYKPTFYGIYGEKHRKRQFKPVSAKKATPRPRKYRPRVTYESYGWPKGPDIKTGNVGPEYEPLTYEYTPYQHTTYAAGHYSYKPQVATYEPHNKDAKFESHAKTYELTEQNYAPYRHFHFGEITDPIATKGDNSTQYVVPERKKKPKPEKPAPKKQEPKQEKPKETPKEKPKEETKREVYRQASPKPFVAVVPLQQNAPPVKKTFSTTGTQMVHAGSKTQPTQTQNANMRTTQTQYDGIATKSGGTQTDKTKSPVPTIVPVVPVDVSPKEKSKVKTRTAGVQTSETPKKTTARGTQYEGIGGQAEDRMTPPMVVPVHTYSQQRTPEYVEHRQQTPVYRAPSRRTPSPEVIVVAAATGSRRNRTPKRKERTPTPPQKETKRTPTPKRSNTPKRSPSRHSSEHIQPVIVPVVTATPRKQQERPVEQTNGSPKARQPTPVTPIFTPEPVVVAPVAATKKQPSPIVDSRQQSAAAKPPSPQRDFAVTKSPRQFISPNKPAQATKTVAPIDQSPRFEPQAGGGFPYKSNRSRLPPEVMLCIEAYDNAHGPGNTVPTIQRTIALV